MASFYQDTARALANYLFVDLKKTATIDLQDLAVMVYVIDDAKPSDVDSFKEISIPIELDISDELLALAIDYVLNPPPPPEEI